MYRQTNLDNSFQLRNVTEMGYLSNDKYPAQNEEYLGKYICVRHKTEYNQMLNQRFHVPEGDYDDYIYPENRGRRRFFQILRWDTEEPYRAILMNNSGEIIVAYSSRLEHDLYDLMDSRIYNATITRAEMKNYDYLVVNETTDADLFFDRLYYEKVNYIGIQDETYLGLEVWTEYDTDLSLEKDDRMLQNRNKYGKLSKETMAQMVKRNPILYSLPDEIYNSYPYYYSWRDKSFADNSRRAINKGYIIRADKQGSIEPELVVMEVLPDESVRFVTQHEARFFYNTDNMVTQDPLELVRRYINK